MSGIRLSFSNIAWDARDDGAVYAAMRAAGFSGLEIAPTRVFPQSPYERAGEAAAFAEELGREWGFAIPSMQSIWFGQAGSIFEPSDAEELARVSAGAFAFARAAGCPSLVFGCPRNRRAPEDGAARAVGEAFLDRLGRLASEHGVRLAIEANAPAYTNYITTTAEAAGLVRRLGNPGLSVNYDLATALVAGERIEEIGDALDIVSHVHVSEPGLAPIRPRPEHRQLARALRAGGYGRFVSVEMARTDLDTVRRTIDYIAGVFA